MLTEEQIKSLKKGDPIVINASFSRVDADGDIWSKVQSNNGSYYEYYACPSHVSRPPEPTLPTLKYDPWRKFKKGDRAQVVERNGRTITCFPAGRIKVGDIVTVAENEGGDVFIKVLTEDGHEMMVPWFMLELITPVEELEPYSIDPANTNVLFKHGKKFASFEDDDAAQEVCKRLNAEWRKEQIND